MRVGLDFSPLCGNSVGGIPTFIGSLTDHLLAIDQENRYYQCYRFSRIKKRSTFPPKADRLGRIYYGRRLVFPLSKLDVFHGTAEWLPLNLHKVPMVMTVHDMRGIRSATDMDGYAIDRYDALKDPAVAIAADSLFTAQEIERLLPGVVDKKRITVIHLGVDGAFTTMQNRQIQERILFVGSIAPNKNVLGLIRAFELILPELNAPVRLCICGNVLDEGYMHKIQTYLHDHAVVASRIEFIHPEQRADLRLLYNESRLCILPSFYEGFGLPVLEAQACSCPVITTRCASLPEVGGESVAYCDPARDEDIGRSLLAVMTDEALRNQMIEAGTENVKRFLWERTAEKYLNLYRTKTMET